MMDRSYMSTCALFMRTISAEMHSCPGRVCAWLFLVGARICSLMFLLSRFECQMGCSQTTLRPHHQTTSTWTSHFLFWNLWGNVFVGERYPRKEKLHHHRAFLLSLIMEKGIGEFSVSNSELVLTSCHMFQDKNVHSNGHSPRPASLYKMKSLFKQRKHGNVSSVQTWQECLCQSSLIIKDWTSHGFKFFCYGFNKFLLSLIFSSPSYNVWVRITVTYKYVAAKILRSWITCCFPTIMSRITYHVALCPHIVIFLHLALPATQPLRCCRDTHLVTSPRHFCRKWENAWYMRTIFRMFPVIGVIRSLTFMQHCTGRMLQAF